MTADILLPTLELWNTSSQDTHHQVPDIEEFINYTLPRRICLLHKFGKIVPSECTKLMQQKLPILTFLHENSFQHIL